MKIHVVSETPFVMQGNGVHTAFTDHVHLLKSDPNLEIFINNEGRGDVFHSHTYGPYYFLKGLGYKGKRVHTVHVIPDSIQGSLPAWKLLMPLVRRYLKSVYNYADVCIAISPMVEDALRSMNVHSEIFRLPNPVPMEKWARTEDLRTKGRKLLGLDKDAFVVLGVGQLQGRKGVEDFVDVAEAIPEARFVWAGGRPFKSMTEGIGRIDNRIAAAPDNLQFTGMLELDTMPMIYAAADLFLFPSYQENCPMAPLEAAASGLPVVFRNLKEYAMLYEHTYIHANNTAEFIHQTRQLMRDKEYYQVGVSLSANLIRQFEPERIRQKLVGLYSELNNRMPAHWLGRLATRF